MPGQARDARWGAISQVVLSGCPCDFYFPHWLVLGVLSVVFIFEVDIISIRLVLLHSNGDIGGVRDDRSDNTHSGCSFARTCATCDNGLVARLRTSIHKSDWATFSLHCRSTRLVVDVEEDSGIAFDSRRRTDELSLLLVEKVRLEHVVERQVQPRASERPMPNIEIGAAQRSIGRQFEQTSFRISRLSRCSALALPLLLRALQSVNEYSRT